MSDINTTLFPEEHNLREKYEIMPLDTAIAETSESLEAHLRSSIADKSLNQPRDLLAEYKEALNQKLRNTEAKSLEVCRKEIDQLDTFRRELIILSYLHELADKQETKNNTSPSSPPIKEQELPETRGDDSRTGDDRTADDLVDDLMLINFAHVKNTNTEKPLRTLLLMMTKARLIVVECVKEIKSQNKENKKSTYKCFLAAERELRMEQRIPGYIENELVKKASYKVALRELHPQHTDKNAEDYRKRLQEMPTTDDLYKRLFKTDRVTICHSLLKEDPGFSVHIDCIPEGSLKAALEEYFPNAPLIGKHRSAFNSLYLESNKTVVFIVKSDNIYFVNALKAIRNEGKEPELNAFRMFKVDGEEYYAFSNSALITKGSDLYITTP